MEVKKGQNMLEHEAEIYSRPARTWFQSGREKQHSEGVSRSQCLFVHPQTVSLALSKRQYENNFQNDNSINRKTSGPVSQAEKVSFELQCNVFIFIDIIGPRNQSVTNSLVLLGARRDGNLDQKEKQKKTEELP